MTEWLSDLRYRLRALLRRRDLERELDDELQFHLEREADKLVKEGLPPDEAMRQARLRFGGLSRIKDDSRDSRGLSLFDTLAGDLRYASRRLRAEPGFTAVVVLTLAIGIGGTAAIFSAVNPILFETLPYPQARRIVMIQEHYGGGRLSDGTWGMYRALTERSRSFEAIAVLKPWQPTATGGTQPERLEGQRISAGYFRVLGVAPALGRDFVPAEDVANGPDVVILSDGLWRRRFNADPAILGRFITLNGSPFTVVGVMPPGLDNVLDPAAELWAPLQYDLTQGRAWGHHLRTVGRLRDGMAVAEVSRELDAIAHAVVDEQRPETYGQDFQLGAVPLRDEVTRGVKPALLAMLGAMALVLIIACVNVTNLLLARGVRRRAEFALRAALGAGHRRLVRQLLTESLLLAALGGAAGMLVASSGVKALIALSPPELPRIAAIGVDGPVFLFAFVLTTVIGVAFGVAPAVSAAHSDPQRALQGAARGSTTGHHRLRGALVVAEVALAVVLLVGSGLLLRSLQRLFAVDSGFDAANVLTMQVRAVGPQFANSGATVRYFEQVLEAVRRVPGVTSAAFTSQLPMSGDLDAYGVQFEISPTETVVGGSTFRYAVTPAYIETMRIALRKGRVFDERDRAGAPLVALLSDSYARRIFRDADPVGQRLRIGPADGPLLTVVGVVADVRQQSLALTEADAVYVTQSQWFMFPDNVMSLVVRSRGDAAALAPAVRQAVWSVDQDQPIVRVAMLADLVAASAAERRFALVLFEAFALAALFLAAAGIYGVLAGRVAERAREIGVRAALGATRGNIVRLVVRQGLTLTGLGVAFGALGSLLATRALMTMLFDVSRLDPLTYGGVVVLLASVALVACVVPAWRAARVDPVSTLRSD